jgi:hypothetical protein
MNNDQIYWIFSSSVQGIAAFIAILLSGYVFVVNVMDNQALRDETLVDVHKNLKSEYYRYLKWLSFLAGFSIIASIVMLIINPYEMCLKPWLFWPTILAVILTVIVGLGFVLKVIDPKKYEKKVADMLSQEPSSPSQQVTVGAFMEEFIKLEKELRQVYENSPFIVQRQSTGLPWPKRLWEIIDIFSKTELFRNGKEVDMLREVIRMRNLLVHGEQERVSQEWIDKIQSARNIISALRGRLKALSNSPA